MAALVESHTEQEVDRAVASGAPVIGVNSRDLETLDVDVERGLGLLGRVPADRVKVFESGVTSREDVARAEDAGANAVLVGEALMRAPEPAARIRELLAG